MRQVRTPSPIRLTTQSATPCLSRVVQARGTQYAHTLPSELGERHRSDAGRNVRFDDAAGTCFFFDWHPTYIETCDQVDPVTRLTSAAMRVLPSVNRTSPCRDMVAQ